MKTCGPEKEKQTLADGRFLVLHCRARGAGVSVDLRRGECTAVRWNWGDVHARLRRLLGGLLGRSLLHADQVCELVLVFVLVVTAATVMSSLLLACRPDVRARTSVGSSSSSNKN